jgi:hypothetical protein
MSRYSILSEEKIQDILQQCCEDGDLETLKSLFTCKHARKVIAHPNTILSFVAEKGHLELVNYLLTSPDLEENANIMTRNDNPFRQACINGHLELVKYILYDTYERTINFKVSCMDGVTYAANSGQLNVLKYFLTSPDISPTNRLSIEYGQNKAFKQAVLNGHLNIVQYVLTSPELSEHANIHLDNDVGFDNALQHKHLDILKYFIIDLNIEKTPYILESLSRYPNENVDKYFEIRDLNSELNKNLEPNIIPIKKTKI